MKNILFTICLIFSFSISIFAQAPQAFKYQSVIRSDAGAVLANEGIIVGVDLLQNSNLVYQENHTVTTNAFGLVNLEIGRGQAIGSDQFSDIDWNTPTSITIHVNINGTWEEMGTSQLLSVPYALHAANGGGNDADADPQNELQTLSQSGNNVTLSDGGGTISVDDGDSNDANELQIITQSGSNIILSDGGGTISNNDADADPNNELQSLSINGNQLSISNGNTITVPSGGSGGDNWGTQTTASDGTLSGDGTAGSPLSVNVGAVNTDAQTLSVNGTQLNISNGNTVNLPVDDADANPTNELQTLSQNGSNVTLSNGGGSINVNDGDADSGNELQTLSINGNQLSISNGNTITVPSGGGSGDNWGTQTAASDNTLSGDGTTGNPLSVNVGAVNTDQQSLSLNGNMLSISNGNSVTLPSGGAAGPWTFNGMTTDGIFNPPGDGQTLISNEGFSISGTSNNVIAQLGGTDSGRLLLSKDQATRMEMDGSTAKFFRADGTPGAEIYGDTGYVGVIGEDNKEKAALKVNPSNGGSVAAKSPLGHFGAQMFSDNIGSAMVVKNNNNNNSVRIEGDDTGGFINTFSPDGRINVYIGGKEAQGSSAANPANGEIAVYNADASKVGRLSSATNDRGQLQLYDENGDLGALLLGSGALFITDDVNGNDVAKASMFVSSSTNGGAVNVHNPDGDRTGRLFSETAGTALSLTQPDGKSGTVLRSIVGDGGDVGVFDPNGIRTGVLFATAGGSALVMSRPDDKVGARIGSAATGGGELFINNASEDLVFGVVTNASQLPELALRNTAQQNGVTAFVDANGGAFDVWSTASNDFAAGAFVNNAGQGVLYADVKNFRMKDPENADNEIWYASLEGPEAGAYERGTAQLVNGEALVTFSDHFRKVISEQNMTVMLTPLSGESLGMAVVEKTAKGFKVVELHKGKGNYNFDWEVKSVRKGFENFQVNRSRDFLESRRPKTQVNSAIPSPAPVELMEPTIED